MSSAKPFGAGMPSATFSFGSKDTSPSLQASVKSVLAESLVDGEFVDIRFFVFTRRLRSGKMSAPRPLYANSAVLKAASPYFAGMLSGGFSESASKGKHTGFPADDSPVIDADMFALEDSDYEDGDDEDEEEGPVSPVTSCDARDDAASARQGEPRAVEDTDASPAAERSVGHSGGRPLRTIVIKDAALTTWQCMVFYLYTGEICFAPLQSQGTDLYAQERARYQGEYPQRPLFCSPKSMYRLADMLGIEKLKTLAFEDIRSKLSAANILDELFSRFSSWHPAVLEMQVKFFSGNCLNPSIFPKMRKKLASVAAEPMPHAAEALASVFEACVTNEIDSPPADVEASEKVSGMKKPRQASRLDRML